MSKKRILTYTFIFLLLATVATIYFCNRSVEKTAEGKLYSDTESIPFNKVGLLLGTSKYISGGRLNPYYAFRIEAARKLIEAGKIKYLIISGDNSRKDYNEPEQMRRDLLAAGVDSSIIYLDYAGFRTFDSMVRLREIFSQTSATVISQPFHNQRAIYIASREGINPIGFNARDLDGNLGFKVQVREKLARVKMFMDFLFGNKPKYLGKKIGLPS
jgi:SanA protein